MNLTLGTILTLVAIVCFGVALVARADIFVPLGLAFFAASHLA